MQEGIIGVAPLNNYVSTCKNHSGPQNNISVHDFNQISRFHVYQNPREGFRGLKVLTLTFQI